MQDGNQAKNKTNKDSRTHPILENETRAKEYVGLFHSPLTLTLAMNAPFLWQRNRFKSLSDTSGHYQSQGIHYVLGYNHFFLNKSANRNDELTRVLECILWIGFKALILPLTRSIPTLCNVFSVGQREHELMFDENFLGRLVKQCNYTLTLSAHWEWPVH
ncbi:hypothetical protein Agabi119p4_10627 [Agaricus bisporus var. burnettii]|uniref:Uncharacterized protein n=1 Tax=Agaricus bisporus var. burnettii TaxID=192524 RepID=A0A8H7C2Y9_AGABI|nr:hypothetical protein Agabi119p4_10627 [Agaricus bisporus var. burnettii]